MSEFVSFSCNIKHYNINKMNVINVNPAQRTCVVGKGNSFKTQNSVIEDSNRNFHNKYYIET